MPHFRIVYHQTEYRACYMEADTEAEAREKFDEDGADHDDAFGGEFMDAEGAEIEEEILCSELVSPT